ncbi:MAG TPA: carboxypeptidase-like regulatory domain-containing protein, partial [Vicinamibacteria bacterium]|nr:carboxypeptidase-like regulatory domain-containing protein [Vicinamibacteria bacterium]
MRLSLLLLVVAALLAPAAPSEAQVLYGSLVGSVADSTKAPVPGATVTIIHKGTNLAREATTRSDGSYNFPNVQPGTYTIRVVLAGFKET